MAKTQYTDGTTLTPARMTTYWGSNASTGHTHDGTDTDGSCPKIDLDSANDVSGQLPNANLIAIDLTTTVTGVLPTANYADVPLGSKVTGDLPLANIVDGNSGAVPCKITTSDLTAEQTFSILWEKHFNVVTIHIPEVSGTSNSTGLTVNLNSATWPSDILANGASNNLWFPITVIDNGNQVPAGLIIDSDTDTTSWFTGILASGIYNTTGYTNSGTKGIRRTSFSYLTQ
jgi:hypothetical protein